MGDLEVTLTSPNSKKITLNTGLFINNEFVKGSSSARLASIDPTTEETIVEVEIATEADVDKAVKAARAAFNDPSWRDMPPEDRGRLLYKLADLVEENKEELLSVQSWEMGKPYGFAAVFELPIIAKCLRYYAGWADKIRGQTVPIHSLKLGYTLKQPIGVCAGIIPWNFPLVNFTYKASAALAAGCCILIKPSELSPLSALLYAKLFQRAGFPPGVVQVLNGYGKETGNALTVHPDIDKVAFTGSTATGRQVIRAASINLKRTTVECGGKSALIVFDDANLEQAAKWAVIGGMGNSGQICSANSRILVQEGAHDKFMEKFKDSIQAIKVGMPFDADTTQGPQVSKAQYDKILGYLDDAEVGGASLVVGGGSHTNFGRGYFIQPTVYTGVTSNMKMFQEEIFGPVVAVTKFKTEDEAVSLANDSAYALSGMVFTENMKTAMRTSSKLRAGTVWVNETNTYDVRMPFGGFKESGFGKELGESGLDVYLEEKSVHVNLGVML